MIRGLDASAAQGPLPYSKLDPTIRFVILKAQQGNDGFDPWFARNMRAALTAGLVPFAYCFAYPLPEKPGLRIAGTISGRGPRDQAKLCVDRVHAFPEMIDRPIMLDLEWPPPNEWAKWGCTAKQISEWCRDFAAAVAELSGATPVLYTYPWWWAAVSQEADTSWAAAYPLWMAAYTTGGKWPAEDDAPPIPKPWDDWLLWQFDGDGGMKLPNGADADFCVFNGDEAALAALATPPLPPAA